ncbi:MAG: AhpC/TSA family protein [Pseudoflavonifractor sp.]|nr:AhpC/TSA family protein [Pseudoflavonifractor sp.]
MKKLLFAAALPLLLAACNGTKSTDNFTVNGVFPDSLGSQLNGRMAFLVNYDTGDTIDSVVIDSARFVFAGHVDAPMLARVIVDGRRGGMFIVEEGTINYDGATGEATGSKLNDDFNKFGEAQAALMQERAAALSNPAITPAQADSVNEAIGAKFESLADSVFAANKSNPIGYYIFINRAYEFDAAQMDSALAANPGYESFTRVKNLMESFAKQKATAPGQHFTDFEVEYNGAKSRLSDYAGKGNYTLVDFWASWCGPCMRELETVREIYGKYNGKGLDVVGVAVWDEPQATEAKIAEKEIPWPNIINAQKIPTDIYGIMGIPHIMLIAPDGTIVERGLHGDSLRAVVARAMEGFVPAPVATAAADTAAVAAR